MAAFVRHGLVEAAPDAAPADPADLAIDVFSEADPAEGPAEGRARPGAGAGADAPASGAAALSGLELLGGLQLPPSRRVQSNASLGLGTASTSLAPSPYPLPENIRIEAPAPPEPALLAPGAGPPAGPAFFHPTPPLQLSAEDMRNLASHTVRPTHVFISYRRAGGSELAATLKMRLDERGYQAFLDVKKLENGPFDQQLLGHLHAAPAFLSILTPGCLDRCRSPYDWVRKEIALALMERKNIIVLKKRGFVFPEQARPARPLFPMPPDIAGLRECAQTLEWTAAARVSVLEAIVGILGPPSKLPSSAGAS
eukprot:tig00000269_g23748.t1